jgi:DnaJ-class molecular chaperone
VSNFHDILGCDENVNPEDLRKAWRKKCMEHHPDQGGDEEDFLKVMHAYKMLTDPNYRMKAEKHPLKDLTFRVQIVVTFLEAFYGTTVVANFSRIELDEKTFDPIKTDKIDPISISVKIPPGSCDGYVKNVKKQGVTCGDSIGDALIKVLSQRHKRYKVRKDDVYTEDNVPLDLMLKGGEHTVDTLWGHRVIWVPPGTVPGTGIKIPGCGVEQNGYQICSIKPVFPNANDLRSSKWKGLNINWVKVQNKNQEDQELIKKFEELKKKRAPDG